MGKETLVVVIAITRSFSGRSVSMSQIVQTAFFFVATMLSWDIVCKQTSCCQHASGAQSSFHIQLRSEWHTRWRPAKNPPLPYNVPFSLFI